MIDFSSTPVLPAVTLEDAACAVEVARALLAGGIRVMEVTFRTPQAAASIRAIRAQVPTMQIGAGTLLTPAQLEEASAAGALFGLSPGFNPRMIRKAQAMNFPFIPGVMTPGEIEQCLEAGLKVLKLFPAEQIGGPGMLRALKGPYGHSGVKFIPMGGILRENMGAYLEQDNVLCVGGSWLATPQLIREKRFSDITRKAQEAIATRRSVPR